MKKIIAISLMAYGLSLAADALEIVAKTSDKYKNVRSFQTRFDRQTCNIDQEFCQLSQGKIWFAEPNLFRVEVVSPAAETYVSDGSYLWVYVSNRKEVFKKPVKDNKMILSPKYFLNNYQEEFDCSIEKEDESQWEIKLTPKDEMYFLKDVILTIEKNTYRVVGFATYDTENTHIAFTFTNLLLNQKIAPKTFKFKVPKGVKIAEE